MGCQRDRAWAIFNKQDRLARITFSRSLAEYICRQEGFTCKRVTLHLGRSLLNGEISSSGLYALCKVKTGWPLRITFFQQLAEWWRHPSRDVREAWVEINQ